MTTVMVVDVGNTSVSVGLAFNGRIRHHTPIKRNSAFRPADIRETLTGLLQGAGDPQINGAVLASVVPEVTSRWSRAVRCVCGRSPLIVSSALDIGVPISYPRPETIGGDRLANACAAVARYDAPVIIADFGTALSFDVVAEKRGYIGGVIAPGLPLMFDYLAEKTALLPHLTARTVRRAVGRSTEEAMQIGAREGYRGMVRGIIDRLHEEIGARAPVCATGGYAGWVLRGWKPTIKVIPNLTLEGLARIYALNG